MDQVKVMTSVAGVALIVATTALVISLRGRGVDEASVSAIERRVYQRVLDETWQEVKPVYVDFGMKVADPPTSFSAMIRPLVSVQSPPASGPAKRP